MAGINAMLKMYNITELIPMIGKQKSYYQKAKVKYFSVGQKTVKTLYSYNTRVAEITEDNKGNQEIKIFTFYSNTTTIHIRDFLYQEAGISGYKKDLLKYLVD